VNYSDITIGCPLAAPFNRLIFRRFNRAEARNRLRAARRSHFMPFADVDECLQQQAVDRAALLRRDARQHGLLIAGEYGLEAFQGFGAARRHRQQLLARVVIVHRRLDQAAVEKALHGAPDRVLGTAVDDADVGRRQLPAAPQAQDHVAVVAVEAELPLDRRNAVQRPVVGPEADRHGFRKFVIAAKCGRVDAEVRQNSIFHRSSQSSRHETRLTAGRLCLVFSH